jgi:hypothetical protein
METENKYLTNMMGQLIEASGVPLCFICGKRIIGAHIDYMDKNRMPRKICIGCTFLSLDYYISVREKALGETK